MPAPLSSLSPSRRHAGVTGKAVSLILSNPLTDIPEDLGEPALAPHVNPDYAASQRIVDGIKGLP